MKVRISENYVGSYPYVRIDGVADFDIDKIFDCGQCFRFDRVENSKHSKEYSGVVYGRFVSFAQDGDTLFIYGSNISDFNNIWLGYLDLERDYSKVASEITSACKSPVLSAALDYGNGIRILSQDPFECIISFIISQNNNIPRIKKIIEALCERCGKRIEICEEAEAHICRTSSLYGFPDAASIESIGVEGLNDLKTGFRSKYIYDAVLRILDGRLVIDDILAQEDTEKAIDMLCEVKGIGRKVASCALLFGFRKYDAFPIDVWMKRVAEKYFSDIENFSPEIFGRYAGIAQQYLFYYERWNSTARSNKHDTVPHDDPATVQI